MHRRELAFHQSSTPKRTEETASSDKIAIEYLKKGEKCRGQNDPDNPMRTGGILKGDGCHELFTRQSSPGSGVCHRCNYGRVEENPHNNCHPDCCEEATSAESRAALLRRLRYRFVACHVIRNDLHDQQHRNKTAVSKKRGQICRRPFARSESHEDNKQRKRAKRGPVLK